MKKTYLFLITVLTFFLVNCSSDKKTKGSLPFIDVSKNYTEKEIILTDIADVAYVHLSTDNDDYLYKGTIRYVTKNTIVVTDNSLGNILFFSKEGNPKSHFNHLGLGPQEYGRFPFVFYNEATDEVYISNRSVNHIQVYSSKGEYKRKLTLPQGVYTQLIAFVDDETLLVCDENKNMQKLRSKATNNLSGEEPDFITNDSSLFLISKTDGKVLDYVNLPNNNKIALLYKPSEEGMFVPFATITYITKCQEGFLLCHPETDTVFLYRKDKPLTPVIHKTPLIHELEPMIFLDNCMDAGRYQFMRTETLNIYTGSKLQHNYYVRDKKTGEVFRQKIILPDYKGKEFFISPQDKYFNEKEYFFELDLMELKQANSDNKLSGKLKELVSALNEEEDNNIFMFVNFK